MHNTSFTKRCLLIPPISLPFDFCELLGTTTAFSSPRTTQILILFLYQKIETVRWKQNLPPPRLHRCQPLESLSKSTAVQASANVLFFLHLERLNPSSPGRECGSLSTMKPQSISTGWGSSTEQFSSVATKVLPGKAQDHYRWAKTDKGNPFGAGIPLSPC